LYILKNGDSDDKDILAKILEKKVALPKFKSNEIEYFRSNPSQTVDKAMISRR
jgi:hypothetical protein